jgi:hypothetical protein
MIELPKTQKKIYYFDNLRFTIKSKPISKKLNFAASKIQHIWL